MDGLAQGGATLESNTQMVELLLGCSATDAVPRDMWRGVIMCARRLEWRRIFGRR